MDIFDLVITIVFMLVLNVNLFDALIWYVI